MSEDWLGIVSMPGIEVSSLGRIRRSGSISFGNLRPDGRYHIRYRGKYYQVHRLVLLAFVGECPSGLICCHADDNPSNNRLDNLRWDTYSSNNLDMVANGNHWATRKQYCNRGHEFTESNTYHPPSNPNKRVCRKCNNRSKKQRGE